MHIFSKYGNAAQKNGFQNHNFYYIDKRKVSSLLVPKAPGKFCRRRRRLAQGAPMALKSTDSAQRSGAAGI